MKTIRIVAAVVDTRQLTMYKEDGTTVTIPQGDPRLRHILEVATPQLQANGWADVSITEISENSYADFQEQSKGIRFFRVAKAKLKKLFNVEDAPDTSHVASQAIGTVPAPLSPQQHIQAMADEVDAVLGVPPSPAATSAPATPVAVATAPVAPEEDEVQEVVLGDERMDGFNKDDDAQDAARDEAAAAAEVPEAVAAPEGTDDQAETFEPVPEQVPEAAVAQI